MEIRTIEIAREAPFVPPIDQLRLRDVRWVIVTPDNVDDVFRDLESKDKVLFAMTVEGYQDLSLNLADLRTVVEQQQRVIVTYEESYKK